VKLPSFLKALFQVGRVPSRVWVFNNMPAGARVDTKVSCPLPARNTVPGAAHSRAGASCRTEVARTEVDA
jgi:hypothetical protein